MKTAMITPHPDRIVIDDDGRRLLQPAVRTISPRWIRRWREGDVCIEGRETPKDWPAVETVAGKPAESVDSDVVVEPGE